MILLFTDFGWRGPYVGQVKMVFEALGAGSVIDLMHDAPAADPFLSSYLLAALFPRIPRGAVCLAVVDPGVGSDRAPVVLSVAGRHFVGPANGLFEQIERRHEGARWTRITADASTASVSFHARDIFAPVAATLARGDAGSIGRAIQANPAARPDWPDDCRRIIHIDHFGNGMTGLRADTVAEDAVIAIGGHRLHRARVFSDVPEGSGFYYRNSLDMIEIAVHRGRACDRFSLTLGREVSVLR